MAVGENDRVESESERFEANLERFDNNIRHSKPERETTNVGYKPLHPELYTLDPATFFVPSFLNAIKVNTEETFRRIITEPSKGILTFNMFHPKFCENLIAEVENYENWIGETNLKIERPNTMNNYGAILDHFGFYPMLQNLMTQFVAPMAAIFLPDVGRSSLDSHHGFVVEYNKDRDLKLGFHVDDCEVTLNVCLGREFSGGDLVFQGVWCERHVNSMTYPKEYVEYSHVPGVAVLHAGKHRHGAKAIESSYRMNLILWCCSSSFRKMEEENPTADHSSCGECTVEKWRSQMYPQFSRK